MRSTKAGRKSRTMKALSKHFTAEELEDETTHELVLAVGFLAKLEDLREIYDNAMVVTNGCRSQAHNRSLILRGYPASPNSFHLIENTKYQTGGCCAVDIARPAGAYLHKLLKIATKKDWSIGVGRTFIHLDRRVDYTNLKPVVYSY